jgi:hypothetical protein
MAARSQKKDRKMVAPESESDDEMSVQVICAPQKKSKKKTTINTLDVSAEEMDYQKKLKWLKDHRCWKCYFQDTLHKRDVLKVDFFPEKISFPQFSCNDYLKQMAEDMLHLLQGSNDCPSLNTLAFSSPILNAYAKVADILRRAIKPTPQPSTAKTAAVPLPRIAPSTPIKPIPVIVPLLPPPVPLPRVPILLSKPFPPPAILRRSPRLAFHSFPPQTPVYTHLAQSIHHDPTIAGKMFNPITGKAETIDSLLSGPDSAIWLKSLLNEWGRCTQGLHKSRSVDDTILGNNRIMLILPHQVPAGRKVMYANFVCMMLPGKAEVF